MKKGKKINIDKIAKSFGAKRRGTVSSGGGYFGALQTTADVSALKRKKKTKKDKKKLN